MAGLSVNEIIDLSVLLVAREETPRVGELPARLGALSGHWFTPTTELVQGRLYDLHETGFVALDTRGLPDRWRVSITEAGAAHARDLSAKAAPGPCAAAMLWHGLRLSLHDMRPANACARAFLEMAEANADLPAMAPQAWELTRERMAAE
ncbi:hypothetical protein [Rhodovibrio salinarum]|uniref:Uncharacterized protein n=1 Tax=Rhodovibrio salinarum TaxID=1087 RepID=A0A934UZ92_9PROT|nr:hypothetical protein [Rhodovibrio salinarum]MBK1696179.1 hypothetical protein [Rhodovibrio salinarum]